MQTTKKIIPIFFILVFLISIIFIRPTKAISYYNHLLNPSFSAYENLVEDGGFESGIFNAGIEYGNFSSATWQFSLTNPHMGLYSNLATSSPQTLIYTFATNYRTYGSDVKNITYWTKASDMSQINFRVTYTDDTYTEHDIWITSTNVWKIAKVMSYSFITEGKIIKSFSFITQSSPLQIDDIRFEVDTGNNSQDEITLTSSPWRRNNILELDAPVSLNIYSGHYDNTSAQFPLGSQDVLLQAVNYIDSDLITTIDLWAAKSILPFQIAVKILLVFSDGTTSEKTMTTNASGWNYLNFGHSWIKQNKYIQTFAIYVGVGNLATLLIDDVGLWSTQPLSYKRFSFTVSPYPIELLTTGFTAYQKMTHTLNLYLWDVNGSLTESGTYIINDNTGTTNGSFTNGAFSYTLTTRSGSVDFYEDITIIITVSAVIETFIVNALWKYVPSASPTGTANTEATTYILFVFIWLFVPSLILASVTYKAGIPVLGFISGLAIMSGIGYSAGVIPLWLLFVCVLCVALLLFGMFRRGDAF